LNAYFCVSLEFENLGRAVIGIVFLDIMALQKSQGVGMTGLFCTSSHKLFIDSFDEDDSFQLGAHSSSGIEAEGT
jgi:hypothetical protein